MDWDTFFMNAIIGTVAGALIGLIGSVIINTIADLRGYRKIENKIGDTSKASLSHQHEDMEEHLGNQNKSIEEHLSNQIGRNAELQRTAIDGVSSIKESLLAQKINEENRYNNLSEKQKDIKSQIDAITALQKDWERLNSENHSLIQKSALLNNRLEIIQNNYNKLSTKCSELVKENNQLKNINHDRSHGRGFPPISL